MSKAKFDAARELIKEKKYDEARAVLKTIAHPTAREWEKKLDRLNPAPVISSELGRPAQTGSGCSRRFVNTVVVLIALVVVVALIRQVGQFSTEVGTAQATTSKVIAPLIAVPSATITETPITAVLPTATIDFAALEATSQAIATNMRPALERQPDLQGVRDISALELANGWSISLDLNIAPADDNEDTMGRILVIVQEQVGVLSQLRVNTYVQDVLQRLWLWEDGKWSVTVMGATAPTAPVQVVFPTNPPPPVSSVSCGGATTCGAVASCAQAYACLAAGRKSLDRDGDGVPCESICSGG